MISASPGLFWFFCFCSIRPSQNLVHAAPSTF
jgi:hypothetical protein